ncbi:MAG: RnfABCDGE type electron transport complex subunit D [Nitrospiraceae bacterium]|nr:RnfABCDGE type electron transport complex subunit D [Nitrospiraceae bacterium]MDA8433334.1 RnfABCDGE type electron transport complex subunit D [Nitrospiraceae bacterium]
MEATKKEHELIVSVSPHVKSEETTSRIMWTVSLALLPAFLSGVYFFGLKALFITALCVLSSVIFEALYLKVVNKKSVIGDGSGFLTGLLLGMNLPASLWSFSPFTAHVPIIASFVAVVITKQLFGGLGFNVFNPALIGRAFALISWPRAMTIWMAPTASFLTMDAKTTATPLGILKEAGMSELIKVFGDKVSLYEHLLTGNRAGSIGETSAIALLIGGLFLLYKKYITWHIPVSFLGTAALIAWVFGQKGALFAGDPLIHLFSGGMMLGALFMATDYVTSPSIRNAQLIFGAGCGALTMLIRLKGGFPEGVMFAILIMNCFAPILDRGFRSRVFGAVKTAKEIKK